MNTLETFLTILFIIVVYLVVINKMPTTYIMGAIALWFTILWIGFDNMNLWKSSNIINSLGGLTGRKNTRNDCQHTSIKPKPAQHTSIKPKPVQHTSIKPKPAQHIHNIDIEKEVVLAYQAAKKELNPVEDKSIPKPHTHLKYSEDNYKYNIFDDIGSLGDNMLAHKQKQRSNMNRVAMDNFSRMQTKNSNINYFEQELKDAAGSRWWDNEELEDEF
jgi:hypothetical protein